MDQAKSEVTKQIAKKLNIGDGNASTAVEAALPMLMKGLANNSQSQEGAEQLANALEKDHDGSVLDNLSGFLDSDDNETTGGKILNHVLGNKQDDAAKSLGEHAKVDSGQAKRVLTMLAPVVLGYLGKQKKAEGLDAMSLAGMLQGFSKEGAGNLGFLGKLLDADGDGKISDDLLGHGMKLAGKFLKK